MLFSRTLLAVGVLALATTVNAATINFGTNPFAGTTALTTPGRQVVGGLGTEIVFNFASDIFTFDTATFGVNEIFFANDLSANLPATGINFVVLRNGAPLNAGGAANAIAAQFTDPGPGFFIYFNTGLDLPRLVFSTDLSDPSADLAILARLTNFGGAAGFNALPTISAANASAVPEPSSFLLTAAGALLLGGRAWKRRTPKA